MRQVAVVPCEHHRRLIPRRAIHQRHEIVIPRFVRQDRRERCVPASPKLRTSNLRRHELHSAESSAVSNIPRADARRPRVIAARERLPPFNVSSVPAPPVWSAEYPQRYSAEYFPFAPPFNASCRCAGVAGNIHGHRRWIRTSGSTIRCRFSRFVNVTRSADSVISSAVFPIPRNTTRASDAAALRRQIVKQKLDGNLRAPKSGLPLDLRKMRIRIGQRDADLAVFRSRRPVRKDCASAAVRRRRFRRTIPRASPTAPPNRSASVQSNRNSGVGGVCSSLS